MSNIDWVLGDMRSFELGRKFGFVISPGHSFQFMTTPDDQVKCLQQIKHHLVPDGLVVIHIDHQDFGWLASLLNRKEPVFEKSSLFTHPTTNQKFRRSFLWMFDPATQNCTVTNRWEEINENGDVIGMWEIEPMHLHCVFPFEMEHLLKRAGFSVEAVYGDFFKTDLKSESEQMIWLGRNRANY